MGGFVDSPEELFLRNALGGTLPPRSLAAVFQPGKARLLPELRSHIRCALNRLSFRERSVLEMRFGLGDGYVYTLAQAGFVFRLTRERVRQIQAKALRKFCHRSDELQRFLRQVSKSGG
jgi:RNA polymerase primary sigma factor